MVYYSNVAIDDLTDILWGLALWKKHPAGYEHAEVYVSDIRKTSDRICLKSFHRNCVHEQHLLFGEKLHVYRRNARTQWYIIYNWYNVQGIACVVKILNNYLTQ